VQDEKNAASSRCDTSDTARSNPRSDADAAQRPAQPGAGISRRQFLTGVAAATGALTLSRGRAAAQFAGALPDPGASGIEHIVVVMMENRSFDHYLGWLPGADGMQDGLSFFDKDGVAHPTHPLAPEFRGCEHPDPDHSYEAGRSAYNDGACDGWLVTGNNDPFAIGYYAQADLGFHGKAAPEWTTFDRYFPGILGPTFPNRIYQHAGQTDRIKNTFNVCQLPTIWDRLAEAGLTGRYYYHDLPFLALWGKKYRSISKRFPSFLKDCITGNLPNVSFVDPRFLGQERGAACDDHPHSDIRYGQAFLNLVYKALTLTRNWSKTVLVINYDEWGGFFDHVAPPVGPIPDADAAAGSDGRRGFRVPCLLIAPWSQKGVVSHDLYDHTSVLKMIEWRWGLDPLTVRDEAANNLAEALDFSRPRHTIPQFSVRRPPSSAGCMTSMKVSDEDFQGLGRLARSHGWRT
jgi:phospholipase C